MFAADTVQAALNLRHPGWKIVYYPTFSSTNTRAWKLYDRDGSDQIIVVTDDQRAGRGRGGNTWISQPGLSLTCSFLPPVDLPAEQAGLLPIIAGLAVAEALAGFGITVRLKWPNDIYHDRRKVGGILCASRVRGDRITTAVLGIGLNVHDDPNRFPADLRDSAGSLRESLPAGCGREQILIALADRLIPGLVHIDGQTISDRWRTLALFIGQTVTLKTAEGTLTGEFRGIDHHGAALLNVNGQVRNIDSGEMSKFREVP